MDDDAVDVVAIRSDTVFYAVLLTCAVAVYVSCCIRKYVINNCDHINRLYYTSLGFKIHLAI